MSLPSAPKAGERFIDKRDAKHYELIFKAYVDRTIQVGACSPPMVISKELLFDAYDGEDGFPAQMPFWIFELEIENGRIVPA